MNSESILFLNWRGEPALKRLMCDAGASVESSSALGARQFETRRDGRFCANIVAMVLDHTPGMAVRTLA